MLTTLETHSTALVCYNSNDSEVGFKFSNEGREMKKTMRHLLSIFLVVALVFTVLPAENAVAATKKQQ